MNSQCGYCGGIIYPDRPHVCPRTQLFVQPEHPLSVGRLTVFMACPHCKGILSEDRPHKCDDYDKLVICKTCFFWGEPQTDGVTGVVIPERRCEALRRNTWPHFYCAKWEEAR